MAQHGSSPISDTPPPPVIIRSKPPSLQALEQQLSAVQQALADQKTGLTQAQAMLAFWQAQPAAAAEAQQLTTINVPNWTHAIIADQRLVATLQAQMAQLLAQIEAAQ